MQSYESKKQKLIADLKSQDGDIGIAKDNSNLFRYRKDAKKHKLDVRNFNRVINIDTENKIAEVEGMTTYEDLVAETLKHGFMPTVVPELKTITIGGAVSGVGIEASSFKFGLVHETITEIEVLLASGKVVVCTPNNQYSDLFFAFPNSYGTLGYILKLKVKLVRVKPFVEIEHLQFNNAKNYFEALESKVNEGRDGNKYNFIDGSVFSESEMYITLGKFTDNTKNISDYTSSRIYYKSIQNKEKDYLTTKDFIWRWDTDWFWCSKHFGVQNKLIRFLFGKKRLNSKTYWKIRAWANKSMIMKFIAKFKQKTESVVQDVEIPIENAAEFLKFFQDKIKIKPIWICPTKALNPDREFDLYPMNNDKLYINFGFWDVIKTTQKEGYYNKLIENKVLELEGKKSLYSTAFYDKETFNKLYKQEYYKKIKAKYDPASKLKDLYSKVVRRL